jgi:hypothetical protein
MFKLSKHHQNLTQILIAILASGVWAVVIQNFFPGVLGQAHAASPAERSKKFDVLNVHRINVVDANGKTRLVISNQKAFPAAKVRGKTYQRSIHNSAGIVFYKANGEEAGGLALSEIHHKYQTALIFDYDYQPTDGIWMSRLESFDGKHWKAGFSIHDRRPYHPGNIKSSQGIERISLADQNHNAQLVISDPKGRPRIRIGVDKNGKPRIQILNADGKVIYRASQVKQSYKK